MSETELSQSSADIDFSSVHDFNKEKVLIMVMGGYIVLRKPFSHFILNLVYLLFIFFVFVYLIVMATATIVFTSFEKVIMVKVLQTVCLLFVGIALPATKLWTDQHLNEALKLIHRGVHSYVNEVPDEEYYNIKKTRVDRIRSLMPWVTKLSYCCAFSNTFFIPIIQVMSINDSTPNQILNPYLPLPIYMPFDTTSYLGFGFAFLTNAIFFFFLYNAIICLIETYLSCMMQVIAQLEIINYSLRNIDKRAYLKLFRGGTVLTGLTEDLYESVEFQKHLYSCLRENVLHHQAILRLTKEVAPFLGIINSICIMSFSIVLAACIILLLENPTMNVALFSSLISDIYFYYEMCRVGQVVTDKSTEVSESLYFTPWPHCHEQFKILLKIMLSNAQKPIIFRATGFNASSSLGTYADMMTLGYKIMNVFRR